MKLIALDDGHGLETPGKRTPEFSDGSVMRENEFNKDVVQLLKTELERRGFKTLLVADGDTDVSLADRVASANTAKADLYISVHANAMTGTWQEASGVETFHYPNSTKSEKLAEILHKHITGGTPLKDRGVKTANFYVLRETKMPAVLMELGFMDNLIDAQILLSRTYRYESAREIANGIDEYYGAAKSTPEYSVYRVEGTTHVVEIPPMNLRAAQTNGSTEKNWVNGNFFDTSTGKPITIGWLASEGEILKDRDNHKKWGGLYDKPKGTLIVFKNGDVKVGLMKDRDMDAVRQDIWFCCQGFNLFPIDLKREGFSYNSVAYTTNRVSIGHNKAKNRVVLAVRSSSNAERAVQTMTNLGCSGSAVCLDSGGSVNLQVGGRRIFKTTRPLSNIISWT